ncbi:MAG: LruC domain-containing protein [Sphingobacteriaceae bacterium]|nr:LruC domain-containing protein [Sphingobacteriaceae bacterium]
MKLCFQLLFSIFLFAFLSACNKDNVGDPNKTLNEGKIAPDGFNFSTHKKVDVNIRLLSNIDEPIKRSMVSVKSSTTGEVLLRGLTDENGYFQSSVNIPAYLQTLIIDPKNPGLSSNITGLILNSSIKCVIGGKDGLSGNVIKSASINGKVLQNKSTRVSSVAYTYMGTIDNLGRPLSYREPQKSIVSANLLNFLASALPDQQDIRNHHPQFVSDNATEHLNIVQLSDVWITFVAEGAGYLNTIGYYTYATNNPPALVSDITEIKLLFPNASALGTGGSMEAGDKVHIGQFPAGTSIGFVLFENGWQNNTVSTQNRKFYSESKFNPESDPALRTHTVLLNYAQENQFIIGFEDLHRQDPTCDHDFNDVILFATSNPVTAISTTGINTLGPATDTDGDGVYDNNDEFPNDPARAYTSYYPSKTTYGTLAFEDNWPAKGDYDMNDIVVKYRYSYIHNGGNQVVEMAGKYVLENAMASFSNGFGVQLPFSPSLVSSVTGQRRTDNYTTLNANGTESGQTNTVILPFENHKVLLTNAGNGFKDTVNVNINFTSPVPVSTITGAPYNPFVISNKSRGVEVHLAGHLPTDKANLNLLGTSHDDSNPANSKYYLSAQNWPWALSFTETFNYPKEGAAINEAYLHFGEWATSGGGLFTDWYSNTAVHYRDLTKIF